MTKAEANLYHKNRRLMLKHQDEIKRINIKIKKTYNINEVLNILRKDLNNKLWNKPVNIWSIQDWEKFNLI